MLKKLTRVADRALSRLVPEIKAQAATCTRYPDFDEFCNGYTVAYLCPELECRYV